MTPYDSASLIVKNFNLRDLFPTLPVDGSEII